MKYLLSLFFLIFLGLAGCNQHTSELYLTGSLLGMDIPKNDVSNISNQTQTGGTIISPISITGLANFIIISGYRVIYSGLFSVSIPKDLDTRSYESFGLTFPHTENLVFSEQTHAKYFYVNLGSSSSINVSLTAKDMCITQTNYNGTSNISKKTITKSIDKRDIFISYITFFTEGNHTPYTYTTHVCFVDNAIIYDIVLDNYEFPYANKIIESFNFN